MNNKGDLISREALKKTIDDYAEKRQDILLWQSDIEAIIDNAPTVEPRIEYGTDGQPYKLSMTNCKEYERPQGEWKLVPDINNDINVVCPFCNKTRIFSYAHGYSIEEVKSQLQEVNDLPNYCENCGAKMKGSKE